MYSEKVKKTIKQAFIIVNTSINSAFFGLFILFPLLESSGKYEVQIFLISFIVFHLIVSLLSFYTLTPFRTTKFTAAMLFFTQTLVVSAVIFFSVFYLIIFNSKYKIFGIY